MADTTTEELTPTQAELDLARSWMKEDLRAGEEEELRKAQSTPYPPTNPDESAPTAEFIAGQKLKRRVLQLGDTGEGDRMWDAVVAVMQDQLPAMKMGFDSVVS